MNFDDNGVDLAVGCTYKYGNSGPGSPAWLYVNKRIQKELHAPIQGWFANEDQFAMGPVFEKANGIRGFQIASPSIIGIRCVQVAFTMIEEAGISRIASKAAIGTQMMIDLFDEWLAPLGYTLLTSRNPQERGGHISIGHPDAAKICVALRKISNVIPDYRAPNAIRLAIAPLPTSYSEVWEGFKRIKELTESRQYETIKGSDSRVT
jgi:kynureninase